jgi:hypothetical protein
MIYPAWTAVKSPDASYTVSQPLPHLISFGEPAEPNLERAWPDQDLNACRHAGMPAR